MKTIAAAFVKAKRAFGPALKDKTNPAFRSKYADLGACIDSVEQALLDNGIAFIQETFEDATGVTVETVFIHESGESMRCGKLHLPASKQDPQGYGSALTYARRYSLSAACGIAPEDDDGNAATKALKEAPKRTGVMADVLDAMPKMGAEDIVYFRELSTLITNNLAEKGSSVAYDMVKAEGLDNEQMIYLWSQLDSKTRSALKREKDARNTTKEPA